MPHVPTHLVFPQGPADRFLPYLTTTDIARLDKEHALVVLPVAAVEQHGPHLPVYTDSLLCQAVLARALELCPADLRAQVWTLPLQAYGKSNEHDGYPGTLWLSAETLLRVLHDIGVSVHRSGFRRFVMLNNHGGNPDVLAIAARDLRQELGLMTFTLNPYQLPKGEQFSLAAEEGVGIHAGHGETSLILALAPELVKNEAAIAELPRVRHQMRRLTLKGGASFGWVTADLSESGVMGDPRMASAAMGEQLLDYEAQVVADLFAEISAFTM